MNGRPDVYDGDTPTITLDLGTDLWHGPLHYRMYGYNSPEMKGATAAAGKLAKEHFMQLIEQYAIKTHLPPPGGGYWVVVKTHKYQSGDDYRPVDQKEKYGRFLTELFGLDDAGVWVNLNERMVKDGFAVIYVP